MADLSTRRFNNFTPVVSAMELADYVFTITDNPKTFPDVSLGKKRLPNEQVALVITTKNDSLVNRVREQAYQIYTLIFTANEINLNRQPYRKEERLSKQKQAISLCEEMLSTIQLCRKHFHLSSQRIKYWGSKVIEVRNHTEKWHDSDRLRFKNL